MPEINQTDVLTGTAVSAATEHMLSVPPGTIRMTAFTAWNTGDLLGVSGRSLILRLPEAAPKNCRVYLGQRWYVGGRPRGSIQYSPEYSSRYIESSRCWLFDIALLKNWFAERPDWDVVVFRRLKALDSAQCMKSCGQRLALPEGYTWDEGHRVVFDTVHDLALLADKDLAVAAWYAQEKGSKAENDLVQAARHSAFACLFYVRFGERLLNPQGPKV